MVVVLVVVDLILVTVVVWLSNNRDGCGSACGGCINSDECGSDCGECNNRNGCSRACGGCKKLWLLKCLWLVK